MVAFDSGVLTSPGSQGLGRGDVNWEEVLTRASKFDISCGADHRIQDTHTAMRRIGPGEGVRLEEVRTPDLKAGEVLVHVQACGLCGSDIPRLLGKDIRESHNDGQHFNLTTLGHEFTGRVVRWGAAVTDGEDLEGKEFAIAPLKPCFDCPCCNEAAFSKCENYSFLGSAEDGAFGGYVAVPRENLIPLPEGVTAREGALLEPLTCVLHPLMQSGYFGIDGEPHKPIDVALVTGDGAIGLLAVQVLKSMGAQRVILAASKEDRVGLGYQCGADEVINVRAQGGEERLRELVNQDGGADLIFDACGDVKRDFATVRDNGTILMVGKEKPGVKIGDLEVYKDITRRERVERLMVDEERSCTIRGSHMSYGGNGEWPGAEWRIGLDLMQEGKISARPLISGTTYSMTEMPEAIGQVISGTLKPVKVLMVNEM